MFQLMNLPHEIILRIIDLVHPWDINALCDSDTEIRAFAEKKVLPRHKCLIDELSKAEIPISCRDDHHGLANVQKVSDMITFTQKYPDSAYYRTDLRFKFFDGDSYRSFDDNGPEKAEEAERVSALANTSTLLESLIDSNFYIDPLERSDWIAALHDSRSQCVAIALLLSGLPALESVTFEGLPHLPEGIRLLCRMVESIANAHRSPVPLPHTSTLSQLREVIFYFDEFDAGSLNVFYPFATLSSMRRMCGTILMGDIEGRLQSPKVIPIHGSMITELDFRDSSIGLTDFQNLLSGIIALRTFIYHHHYVTANFNDFPAKGIVQLLRQYARTSLAKLHLSSDPWGLEPIGSWRLNIGSLRDFSTLRDIRIDDQLFERQRSSVLDRRQWDWHLNAERLSASLHNYEGLAYRYERLVDVLPPATETLTLITSDNSDDLFKNMVDLRHERLPRLSSIMFEGALPQNRYIVMALSGIGVRCQHNPNANS